MSRSIRFFDSSVMGSLCLRLGRLFIIMKAHKRIIWFCSALVVLAFVFQVLPWWLGRLDFDSLRKGSVPRFARLGEWTPDGGSTNYVGFGYTLWNLQRLTNLGAGRFGQIIGPSIE